MPDLISIALVANALAQVVLCISMRQMEKRLEALERGIRIRLQSEDDPMRASQAITDDVLQGFRIDKEHPWRSIYEEERKWPRA